MTVIGAVGATGAPGAAGADPGWRELARVARGEADAFAGIVERHQERLLRLCMRLLEDPEEARDAAQDVLLKAYNKAAEVEPRGQVYTWLYRIAVNHCLNKLRRRKLVRFLRWGEAGKIEGQDDALPFDPAQEGASPEEALAARRRWAATRRALDRLPENQRTVVVLVRFEGMAYKQVAEVLGITEGAVESRLFRAMRRLEGAQDSPVRTVPPKERVL